MEKQEKCNRIPCHVLCKSKGFVETILPLIQEETGEQLRDKSGQPRFFKRLTFKGCGARYGDVVIN